MPALTPRTMIIAAIAIVLFVLICNLFTQCQPAPSETDANTGGGAAVSEGSLTQASASAESADQAPDRSKLKALIGAELADALIAASEADEDAYWIASHPDVFDLDGPEVQEKILELAAKEPESYAYVREFPDKFPAADESTDKSLAMSKDSPSDDVPSTDIPHYYQWDRRWAQTVYCSTTFGLTGCGPTTLAMIYNGLIPGKELTPYELGQMAQEAGYMAQYDGTTDGFFTDIAGRLGLNCEVMVPTEEDIVRELEAGHPIIVNLAPGYFTQYGHFFVLAGLDKDGKVIINDPYSVVRSSQTWDVSLIAQEARNMFVYSV